MKTSPQLSVIIPTYNRAALLRKALESVLQQTFSNYEIIVVDDGSTDRTEDSIAQLITERPAAEERVRYLFQKNQGKSVALNYGLSEARGEWIAFLDSDDVWLPVKIEEQFRALQQFAPLSEACFTDARFINDPSMQTTSFELAGKWFSGSTGVIADSVDLVEKVWIYMQTVLVHSRVIKKVGEFDPALWTGQDMDFVFRLSLETRLCYVNHPLVLIDRTPGRPVGLTEKRLQSVNETSVLRQRMFEKWLRLSKERGAEDLRRRIRSELRRTRSQQANSFLIDREYREARRCIALAARTECTPGIAVKWILAVVAPALARRIVIRRFERAQRSWIRGGGDPHDCQAAIAVPQEISRTKGRTSFARGC
jgi:glycosyltransferase involved in cell wall biosynthesis